MGCIRARSPPGSGRCWSMCRSCSSAATARPSRARQTWRRCTPISGGWRWRMIFCPKRSKPCGRGAQADGRPSAPAAAVGAQCQLLDLPRLWLYRRRAGGKAAPEEARMKASIKAKHHQRPQLRQAGAARLAGGGQGLSCRVQSECSNSGGMVTWTPHSVSPPSGKPCPGMASRRYSTPTRAPSSPARTSWRRWKKRASASA